MGEHHEYARERIKPIVFSSHMCIFVIVVVTLVWLAGCLGCLIIKYFGGCSQGVALLGYVCSAYELN